LERENKNKMSNLIKKIYEFGLEKIYEEYRLTNYHDKDSNFKCTTPVSNQDKIVVEHLKGLMEKLNLDELNVKIEIK